MVTPCLAAVLVGGALFWRAAPLYRQYLLERKTQAPASP